jgi:hypothetical protein
MSSPIGNCGPHAAPADRYGARRRRRPGDGIAKFLAGLPSGKHALNIDLRQSEWHDNVHEYTGGNRESR